MASHFTSVRFQNYKTFRKFVVPLGAFNVLVGPNNAGKSTVIGAFRILAEAIRRARARNPEYVDALHLKCFCYSVALRDLPVSTENVFCDYDDSDPAIIEFTISNGNRLKIVFLERDSCYLLCETLGKPIRNTTDFRREFDVSISFVPVLGPVEHDEKLNTDETARRALLTHRASRNFRNIWYHFPQEFESFRTNVRQSWPGMDVLPPELTLRDGERALHMFCPEERIERELYWAGFGFQVWCQMLTFVTKAEEGSLLVVDEPDIYLHSDLQRQLVGILRARNGDILLATHSTEILSEVDAGEILVLNKKWNAARRIQNPAQLQSLFGDLGSRLNPTITQLAKTRRALFVEGEDFSIISSFARKIGNSNVANGANFAVLQAKGFNPTRVRDCSFAMEQVLGASVLRGVIFDRDYRSDRAVRNYLDEFGKECSLSHIHDRKEIENFLLVPSAIERAILARVKDRQARGAKVQFEELDLGKLLESITSAMKHDVLGQYTSERIAEERDAKSGIHIATTTSIVAAEFDGRWAQLTERFKMAPGKLVLSKLNTTLQTKFGITVSPKSIINAMLETEIPREMRQLIRELDGFASRDPTDRLPN
jgi:energy-coupling factor transporter ATP-binding protein EcfA2